MSSRAPAARAAGHLDMKDDRTRANMRTALILLSIALVFFLGVMAKYWLIRT
jgi:hypothetical protein